MSTENKIPSREEITKQSKSDLYKFTLSDEVSFEIGADWIRDRVLPLLEEKDKSHKIDTDVWKEIDRLQKLQIASLQSELKAVKRERDAFKQESGEFGAIINKQSSELTELKSQAEKNSVEFGNWLITNNNPFFAMSELYKKFIDYKLTIKP